MGGNKVKIMRGERLMLPLLILGLCVIPILAIARSGQPLDALRWFTIAQAVVVGLLYAYAIGESIHLGIRQWRSGVPQTALTLRAGRVLRLFAIEMLLYIAAAHVYSRLGSDSIITLTPIFQITLIFLLLAWLLSERTAIHIERRSTNSQIQRIFEDIEKAGRQKRKEREEA